MSTKHSVHPIGDIKLNLARVEIKCKETKHKVFPLQLTIVQEYSIYIWLCVILM